MTHADVLAHGTAAKPAALGFGCMRFPGGIADVKKMTDRYLEAGFNYFDTAYVYGGSEEALKKALTSRHPRDSYLVADKIPPWMVNSPKDCDRIYQEMLKRLGLDYIDFLLIHSLDDGNERNALKANVYEWAAAQKKKGTAKHVGFSFHGSTELLARLFADHPEMEFVQLQLNYIDVLRGQAGAWQRLAVERRKPIIVMEPVKGGTLAKLPPAAEALLKAHAPEASVASWAVRYAATLAGATCMLSGMSSPEQMEDNLRTFKPLAALDEKEMAVLQEALDELSKVSAIPCTACGYCLPECPQSIDIPSCLNLYNEVKRGGAKWNLASLYHAIPDSRRAEACTSCGLCAPRCPQHIDIPKGLKETAGTFK